MVPWCLYIIMVRTDMGVRNDGFDHIQDFDAGDAAAEANPLLGIIPVRTVEHYAIPVSWALKSKTKIRVSIVLVVGMSILAIFGTAQTIYTSASGATEWDCSTVGAG